MILFGWIIEALAIDFLIIDLAYHYLHHKDLNA
jgi:hypothetical protein